MKLQIVTDINNKIEGFETVVLTGPTIDIKHIFTNECHEILLGECVNKIPIDSIPAFLGEIFSKLRKGGKLKMNFINPRLLSMSLLRDEISLEDYNTAIYSNNSLMDLDMLESVLASTDLEIETCTINGVGYDVTITR